METWVSIVSGLGFPIAVCLWFMFRTEKSLKQIETVINNNTVALTKVEQVLKEKLH